MKEYPQIDDFIIDRIEHVIPPEVEQKIIEDMEKWELERRRNQAQTIIDARNIILK